MCEAIVLAAGFSQRANTNKLLLVYNRSTIIESVIDTLSPYCSKIIVVTGHYHKEIDLLLNNRPKVVIVKNNDYYQGMFSSVQTGAKKVQKDFFIIPGDYPSIRPSTIEAILKSTGDIVVPTYQGKKGHPLFMSHKLVEPLLKASKDANLKLFRDGFNITYVEVDDEGILRDIDTMKDYYELIHYPVNDIS